MKKEVVFNMNFLSLIFMTLLILKVGNIGSGGELSWWVVFLPILFPFIFAIAMFIIGAAVSILKILLGR